MTNDNDKIEKIINIYEKMNFDNNITIIYNIDKNEKIKIFGKKFVEKNKNKCKIMYEDKIYDLTEEFNIKNSNEEKIIIKLLDINNITNMSELFCGCKLLESLLDISKWNTSKITDMSHIFEGCSSLYLLPNISRWDTSNVSYMECMFEGC